ncbi:MAG TPA: maltotransferase domain-containing protein, partial [Pirellulales bacterium]|nr:maltotransferase domain-containing protein [Pirellulales bacterium]
MLLDGRQRVVIDRLEPELDGGRFAIKRVVGDELRVQAFAVVDGHDLVAARLVVTPPGGGQPLAIPMISAGQDRYEAALRLTEIGRWTYTVEAWVDEFRTWQRGVEKKLAANQPVDVERQIGRALLERARTIADPVAAAQLDRALESLRSEQGIAAALDPALAELLAVHGPRRHATRYDRPQAVVVDPVQARYSSWYEFFPRSMADAPRHGTFHDCIERLPQIAAMGFDVLYLPPIHPIGRSFRKGKNNAPAAEAGDVGSPWGIGAAEGGHTAVHPQLGTLDDFRRLVTAARERKIDVALDIALQCSPDHPWVREHPQWFKQRPDGTIQYAENAPKKYQDIYPLWFETDDWQALWQALKGVFEFWIEQGVRVFRVDNPHNKPFAFWQW